jgi:hypothetical protein
MGGQVIKPRLAIVSKLEILVILIIFQGIGSANRPFLSGTVDEGFRSLRWKIPLDQALKEMPDLYLDHYSVPAGDQIPFKVYSREDEDRKVGNIPFELSIVFCFP